MTKTFFVGIVFGLAALASDYERKPDRTSAAGLLLEEVDLQTDPKQRLALLEGFVEKYPKHPSAPWAWDQIRARAVDAGDWNRVIDVSARMLEANGDDPWSAQRLLDASEKSGDPAKLAKALETAETVAEVALASKGRGSKDDAAKRRQEAARKVAARAENLRLRLIAGEPDPRKRLTLLEGFEKRYPKSAAADGLPVAKALALWMAGDPAAAPASQDAVKRLPESEDAHFLALASGIAQDPGNDNSVPQALWLLEMMQRKTRPECLAEADWNHKRDLYIRTVHLALGLAAHRRGDRHLARRAFASASVHAEGNASAKSLLDAMSQGKGDAVPGAVGLASAQTAGFDPRLAIGACATGGASEAARESR